MAKSIVVVIPSSGRPELLKRTVASLHECDLPDSYEGAYIVENGPQQRLKAIVNEYESRLKTRYIHEPIAGKNRALNRIIKIAADSLLFFTDDDVRIQPNTIRAYDTASKNIDEGFFFGGPIGVDRQKMPYDWLEPYLPPCATGWSLGNRTQIIDDPLFIGQNWAAFARDLQKAGAFDERIGPGSPSGSCVGDETDMQARLLKNGLKAMYLAETMVWHYVPEERCNPTWLIKRTYGVGVYWGFHYHEATPILFGAPRWMYRMFARRMVQLLSSLVGNNPEKYFVARSNMSRIKGLIHGYRFGRKAVLL